MNQNETKWTKNPDVCAFYEDAVKSTYINGMGDKQKAFSLNRNDKVKPILVDAL